MAVSAVLLSMAYLALRIVQQQQQSSVHTLRELSKVNTLQWLLARDFRRARQVTLNASTLYCQFSTHEVTYQVQDSSIVRQQSALSDTFALPGLQGRYWLQGHPVTGAAALLDEASFTLRYRGDTLQLLAKTQYDACQLLQVTSNSSAYP